MANSRFIQLAIDMKERGVKLSDLEKLPKEFHGMPKGVSYKLYCEGVLKRESRTIAHYTTYGKGTHYKAFMEAFADVSQP